MRTAILSILSIILLECCTSDGSYLETEVPSVENNDEYINKCIEHNLWTYEQMKKKYFWYDEMPDSTSLDFTQEPSSFFEFLKSKQDRFSWCEANLNYKGSTRSLNLSETVSLDTVYTLYGRNFGYVVYEQFNESSDVVQIMIKMRQQSIDDFILDLRNNPGGYVSTSNYLASFLVPKQYGGRLFQQQRYNDKQVKERKKIYGGEGIDSIYLNNNKIVQSYNLNLNRLFVLTSENSASSSEALIIGLRPYMRVITIGKTTCGKDVGSYTIANNHYKYQLQPITFRYYNALGDSTPVTGIIPDIPIFENSHFQKGDIRDPYLQAVFNYILKEYETD